MIRAAGAIPQFSPIYRLTGLSQSTATQAPTSPSFNDSLISYPLEDLGLMPGKAPAISETSVPTVEQANPKPAGFDPEFDSFVRQFTPKHAFISPDGSKALVRLGAFAEQDPTSITQSFLDRPFLSNRSFWVDLNEGRADQLADTGSGSENSQGFSASFEGGARIEAVGGSMELKTADGKSAIFSSMGPAECKKMLDSVSFMSLPKVHVPGYLAQLPDGNIFLVTESKTDFQYKTCKAYLGTAGNMQPVEINSFRRMMDGTTTLQTSAGQFFSPADGGQPTFNDQPVTLLPTEDGQNADMVASLGVDMGQGEEVRMPVV